MNSMEKEDDLVSVQPIAAHRILFGSWPVAVLPDSAIS